MNRLLSFLLLPAIIAFALQAHAQVWTQTGAVNASWNYLATSADGINVAVVQGTKIYTSTNSGATWNPTLAPAKNWDALASSGDGKVLLATATSTPIYTSIDSGNSWQTNAIPPNSDWGTAAAAADGNPLVVSGQGFAPVYYSTNRGGNWRSNGIPGGYWTSVVCTADGSKLAASCMNKTTNASSKV